MRPQGSPAELERRRMRAMDLLERDVPVHVDAERLGVDRRSVRRWKRARRRRGLVGLKARPASGRPPKLKPGQRRALVRAILERPETAGYRTAPWTCRRTVQFVRERFGVSYHPDHIGRLLRACGLSPQQPQRTAKDHRVRAWMQEEWPRVKELGRRRAWLICLDQTG